MTRSTIARVAGFTFLFYIAVAFPSMVLMNRAVGDGETAAKLARIAEHASDVRWAVVLSLFSCLSALVLAVALYGITRTVDHELAMLTLVCRSAEGALGAIGIPNTLGLLWLATAAGGAGAPDVSTASTLGTYLLMPAQSTMLGAPFFAVGSLVFSYLLLRRRIVPVALARVGLLASILLVVGLPLQLVDLLPNAVAVYMWLPMLAFEVPLGLWLLVRGVGPARS
jgi:hypothetical protein